LSTLLGLAPEAFDERLDIIRPKLPQGLDRLDVSRLRVGQAIVDLTFRRGKDGVDVEVAKLDGRLRVEVRRS
jgi:hypothetical protein